VFCLLVSCTGNDKDRLLHDTSRQNMSAQKIFLKTTRSITDKVSDGVLLSLSSTSCEFETLEGQTHHDGGTTVFFLSRVGWHVLSSNVINSPHWAPVGAVRNQYFDLDEESDERPPPVTLRVRYSVCHCRASSHSTRPSW
jgi:hypothetical protein